ncbi:MAG: hypothetical protein K9G38_07615 [Bacteroidales bacterium]|nr:hypothetical protein [Bacteroidales bacterium]
MIYPLIQWALKRPGIIIPVFFLSLFRMTTGQETFPGAGSLALGGISSLEEQVKQVSRNPALPGSAKGHLFAAGHARPFLLKEIGITTIEGVHPAFPGTVQWRISNYGLKGFRQFESLLGFGMLLTENLSAGVSFHYNNTVTKEQFSYLWTIGPGAGIHYRISPRTAMAVMVINPFTTGNHARYGPGFPAEISMGISRVIYENTTLFSEMTFLSNGLLIIKTGLSCIAPSGVTIRAGYHAHPHTFSFGAGIRSNQLLIDLSFAWSAVPGITPATMVTWQYEK